ncbi:MAG: NusG domain II-containing protein [Lachnospiraceae bacterium]|nr:NusG domain II-containing protein [Lachnospiraceae bacterium]
MFDRAKIKKTDIILIILILIIAACSFLWYRYQGTPGAAVEVYLDGALTATYPLEQSAEYELTGAHDGHNHLVIADGKASITDADCPDKLCVKQRAISKNGETICCLPHKLVIKISGGMENELDAVTN